ncbi:MAG: potassium channel family protein [Pontibacterium sp.]
MVISVFTYVKRVINRHLKQLNGRTITVAVLVYALISWFLLHLAGEESLTGQDFFYWLVVTASTVGYGDLSPTTNAGKWITILFIIPTGLSLFALSAGKIAAISAQQWRKGIMGLKTLNLDDHILVIGWSEQHTANLLKLLIVEAKHNRGRKICLAASKVLENPLPGDIEFVRTLSYNDEKGLQRASIDRASTIIVYCDQDDFTLTAALYAYSQNKKAHIIAHFQDESLSDLLKQHCPTVECAPSVETELMVKAAMDPGSSVLHKELLSAGTGMTQYAVAYPENRPATTVEALFETFKREHDATLIGLDLENDGVLEVNPPLSTRITHGCTIYYIAQKRILQFKWPN